MLLTDLLRLYKINPEECQFFRYGKYMNIIDNIEKIGVKEYCSNCFNTKKKYLLFFLADTSTKSVLKGAYEVGEYIKKEEYNGELLDLSKGYLQLTELKELDELVDRLEIYYEFKQGWNRYSFDEVTVSALYPKVNARKVPKFTSYENIYLSYEELKEVVNNGYLDYKLPLMSINAIYMIIDKTTGKQYIGSAYGEDGLYGRWETYVNTEGTGNNVMLKELNDGDKEHYLNYSFHILRVLPHSMDVAEIIKLESMYKEIYMSKIYGLNKN